MCMRAQACERERERRETRARPRAGDGVRLLLWLCGRRETAFKGWLVCATAACLTLAPAEAAVEIRPRRIRRYAVLCAVRAPHVFGGFPCGVRSRGSLSLRIFRRGERARERAVEMQGERNRMKQMNRKAGTGTYYVDYVDIRTDKSNLNFNMMCFSFKLHLSQLSGFRASCLLVHGVFDVACNEEVLCFLYSKVLGRQSIYPASL